MSINIINRALIKLGQPIISSTSQEPNGRLYAIVYKDMRDLLLVDHTWRFALKRVILAPDEERPVTGFAYSYTLPADFLSLFKFDERYKQPNYEVRIVKSDERYSIEGNKILCNIDKALRLQYVAKIEDTSLFTPWFRETLVTKVASELAMRLKQAPQLMSQLNQEFASYLERAELNNEILRDTETLPDASWVGVRGEIYNEY